MNDRPGRLDLSNKARKIDSLCEELRRVMTPFAQTLEWMTGDKFPKFVAIHVHRCNLDDDGCDRDRDLCLALPQGPVGKQSRGMGRLAYAAAPSQ